MLGMSSVYNFCVAREHVQILCEDRAGHPFFLCVGLCLNVCQKKIPPNFSARPPILQCLPFRDIDTSLSEFYLHNYACA